jgi:hypothetical protein
MNRSAANDIEKVIQAATAARYCALGYYVATDLELAEGYRHTADVAGIRPILQELKKRSRLGPAPAGVLCLLGHEEWTPTETIIEGTGKDANFARGVLLECEEKGWVEKRILGEDVVHWRLRDYRFPAREAFVVRCGSSSPTRALEDLRDSADCCNLSYLVLDYEVDKEFMDCCFHDGIGLMVYVPRNGYFREILGAESREIKDRRGFMSLCERILFENYVLRRDEWV